MGPEWKRPGLLVFGKERGDRSACASGRHLPGRRESAHRAALYGGFLSPQKRRRRLSGVTRVSQGGALSPRADVSLALLAGGRSRRMGRDKALIPFAGGTLIEWLRDRLAPGFSHTFVVAKDVRRFRDLGVPAVTDARPEDSPTCGVYTALLASPTPRTICLGCDVPFVTRALLERLADMAPPYEVLVPRDDTGLQPMCAVYSRGALPALERMLDEGRRRLDLIVDYVHAGLADVAELGVGDPRVLFFNVNTPRDLETARRLAQGLAPGDVPAATDLEGAAPEDVKDTDEPPFARLAPRVVDFMARAPVPTVSFVGKKKSGKTTVLEGVIGELAGRGRRVAAVKHDTHGFSVDVPGTDTHRLREAGATTTVISSSEAVAVMSTVTEEPSLLELIGRIQERVDLVLTEGFVRQPAPKVEVSRAARSDSLIMRPEELLAVAADQPFPKLPVPQLAIDDFVRVADLLERHMTDHHKMRTWRRDG